MMGLKKLLDAGMMVIGSPYDGKVKSMGEMSERSQKTQGYTDSNGFWTDRGHDRATSKDYANLEKSRRVRK
ncbi:hypothetical protein Q8A64_00125 [Oxalobacteraceae bacterium R-40]|uniref:Uncharacterized protein n=1 Tax=Keguizhuia sedimenti TaxID=3064264 RepID=A0ABU1BIX1_9BURK|nr:hypothetical protein [Oxalobacteraceae bacterium R-40]